MRIDVTYNELSGSTCVFVYEWRQTVPQANLYTQTHILMGGVTPQPPSSWSVVEPGALPESLPSTRVHPPHCLVYYTNATPLFLFSLFFLCLSLINQCQAVQQQGRHSFSACLLCSSYMSLCHDPPPCTNTATTIIFSHGCWNPGPHCQHKTLVRDSVRKREKNEKKKHFSHFCLFVLYLSPSFLLAKRWGGSPQSFT